MALLCAQQLVMDVPGRAAGEALSLTINAGQRWGILGPNGAGKTTLLHTLAGLRAPRQGQIYLQGRPLALLSRRTVARRRAVVFQERQDSFPATVLETALIGRHPFLSAWQWESPADRAQARAALAVLGLDGLQDRQVSTLSGGERQRVALATALTQNPALWLVDEPTNHLDLHHQVAVMSLLARQADAGAAVVMCLHDLNLAARWCDHLLLLYPDGQLCFGPASQMLVPAALETLYGQRLAVGEVDGRPVFMPAAGEP
ncbi:MAG: ABC transporter ATP-binding protein [Alcanivorax sp.]|nr:ABC transporter ATP-binding protein [Alcanivorax sp.]